MSETAKPPKLRNACNECHASKVKCSGERTGCKRCVNAQQPCTYSISMVGKVQNQRKRQARREKNRASWPVSPASTEIEQHCSPAELSQTITTEDRLSTPRESGVQCSEMESHGISNPDQQQLNKPDIAHPTPALSNKPMMIHESGSDMFWGLTPDDMFDDGMMFNSSLPSNSGFETFSAESLDEREGIQSRRMTPSYQQSPSQHSEYVHSHVRSIQEHQINNHTLSEEPYRRGSRFENPIEIDIYSRSEMGMPVPSSSLESRCPSLHSGSHSSLQSSTFGRGPRRSQHPLQNQNRRVAASRCMVVVTKLQRLAREVHTVTVDVLLATNKNALIELNGILNAEMRNDNDPSRNPHADYFRTRNGHGNEKFDTSPVGLMIYVIALQYVTDLYTQACHLFLTQRGHDSSLSSPASSSSSSGNSRDVGHMHSSLPQLDFGTFKIDIADQRRLFAEIIGRELGTALGVCGKVRDGLSNQPVDISAPAGLFEETFLGIEVQLRRLIDQMKL